ncbi:MAG: parallel beta-helix domain-containing protein [Hyphomonadaceae bacterium]|nr:parallel beta-helix domain-containing protein [Hyphomonadaceae bacterium]
MNLMLSVLAAVALMTTAAEARTWRVRPGPDAQELLQGAFIQAEPGDTIRLTEGRYELWAGLSLDVDRVTLRGEGADRTILSFTGQRQGAEGILITSDDVTFRDFAVENAKGDAIKAQGCARITLRDLRVEWTGGPNPENGAYGLYPVNCTDVLIDGAVVRGASDAGIYVGQSRNIIVRNSLAEYNVAGIEIENSFNADVYRNVATRNTGGILVFDLPGLPQQGGHAIRLFENRIVQNDTPNFAPAGNIVAGVPTGTGVMVMANRDVHVFENEIGDNGTANVLIVAYRAQIDDPNYNPLPRDVTIRNNRFGRSGFAPAGDLASLAAAGVPLPDILWDGATNYVAAGTPRTEPVRIALIGNRKGERDLPTFLSLGVPVAGADLTEAAPDPTPPPAVAMPEPERVRLPQD